MSATRRRFLRNSVGAALGLGAARLLSAAAADTFPPVRPLTSGPRFHWFGYYDKLQFDPDRPVRRWEWRSRSSTVCPRPADRDRVGMVDTADHDRWIDLGES